MRPHPFSASASVAHLYRLVLFFVAPQSSPNAICSCHCISPLVVVVLGKHRCEVDCCTVWANWSERERVVVGVCFSVSASVRGRNLSASRILGSSVRFFFRFPTFGSIGQSLYYSQPPPHTSLAHQTWPRDPRGPRRGLRPSSASKSRRRSASTTASSAERQRRTLNGAPRSRLILGFPTPSPTRSSSWTRSR